MSSPVVVALCADKNVEVSLHVTLYSLLNSSHSPIDINLVQKGYNAIDIANIHKTLRPFSGKYQLNVVRFDERELFGKFWGLHGSQFNFAKLVLAHLLPEKRVIYLDSDLTIGKDLSELFATDLNGSIIGAVSHETIADSLRSTFYQSIGMNQEARYFNSGVMLMDLQKWREEDITAQCLDFANKYVERLRFGDEAILNCIFYENFQPLNCDFNYPLYPDSAQQIDTSDRILHFVGSPKPFDLMGEFLHSNYAIFSQSLIKTHFKRYKSYFNIDKLNLKRTFKLLRSYYKCLSGRFARQRSIARQQLFAPKLSKLFTLARSLADAPLYPRSLELDPRKLIK